MVPYYLTPSAGDTASVGIIPHTDDGGSGQSVLGYYWMDRSGHLDHHGYTLRKRHRKWWVPSWVHMRAIAGITTNMVGQSDGAAVEATRQSDGLKVHIKAVKPATREIDFPACFSTHQWRDHPSNHFLPVLDVLEDPLDANNVLMVTPHVRPLDYSAFSTLGEIIDFMEQTLRGMQLMHGEDIAHRDCGVHSILIGKHLDWQRPASTSYFSGSRSKTKYYFTGFSLACYFAPGLSRVLGSIGGKHGAPELSDTVPYDAFKLDIFILGRVFQDVLDHYCGLSFLKSLPYEMTRSMPESRPDAFAAYNILQGLKSDIPARELRCRLEPLGEGYWIGLLRDYLALARELKYHLRATLRDRSRLRSLFWGLLLVLKLYHSFILSSPSLSTAIFTGLRVCSVGLVWYLYYRSRVFGANL